MKSKNENQAFSLLEILIICAILALMALPLAAQMAVRVDNATKTISDPASTNFWPANPVPLGSLTNGLSTWTGSTNLTTTAVGTLGTAAATAATNYAPATRTISTTAPITGGGNLTANLTLAISAAATNSVGAVQLATDAEIQTGTDTAKAVRPSGLAAWWTWIKTQAQTFASNLTVNGNATLGDAAGDEAVINDDDPRAPNLTSTTYAAAGDDKVLLNGNVGDARYFGGTILNASGAPPAIVESSAMTVAVGSGGGYVTYKSHSSALSAGFKQAEMTVVFAAASQRTTLEWIGAGNPNLTATGGFKMIGWIATSSDGASIASRYSEYRVAGSGVATVNAGTLRVAATYAASPYVVILSAPFTWADGQTIVGATSGASAVCRGAGTAATTVFVGAMTKFFETGESLTINGVAAGTVSSCTFSESTAADGVYIFGYKQISSTAMGVIIHTKLAAPAVPSGGNVLLTNIR